MLAEELAADTLQELGTLYRLHGAPDVALQHLERALAIRERCHGAKSLKVAETLNSLALVSLARGDAQPLAEELQLRSMRALFESAEPEDIESEDVPWEVYKRLKQQRGPSTARNSVTLLKGNMRKRVLEVVYAAAPPPPSRSTPQSSVATVRTIHATATDRSGQGSGPSSPVRSDDLSTRRAVRSQSDSGAMKRYVAEISAIAAPEAGEEELLEMKTVEARREGARHGQPPAMTSSLSGTPASAHRLTPPAPPRRPGHTGSAIQTFSALQARVEGLKHRIAAGLSDTNEQIAQLTADVDAISAAELRDVGVAMLSLVREMHRLRVKSDSARSLPVLEGRLEKKSASIFRGWEKRWFKVDPKTFVLSYHFSRDDYTRGFAPRGGFPVSRISNILVHRHAHGSHFQFDVVVDLSTRLNPLASRTYEFRCEDQETLRYWVETLHYYKATAQTTPARPSTS